ncbi:GGDEF domain-containing response regulator [Desulfosoma caldarium]|uniref:diguanylate cyclase n=1 Tax=Desulfosoma caldarium TaxID=610254 RepID=A0A3N1UM17_9BACT|nr:diguanylate cyclase [Desulfosoma caldarium]ROQ91123.1 response regulator receiver modulated diguanylate cyclase [Desulfosoma caldarium]
MTTPFREEHFGPQRILVVDDEVSVRELVSESLSYIGHQVDLAADGLDACEKLKTNTYDIVITDMDMPRMDGMELIHHIRQHYPHTDSIAITGHATRYKYVDVIRAGAADFITKPFGLDKLEAKIRRLLRERYLRSQLEELAIRDPLTGLFNRRHFRTILLQEAVRAVRYGHSLFLLFIDIDLFKQYNDKEGHQAGDLLLVELGAILQQSIREHVDSAFRYGGDEFTVVLPHLNADQVRMVVERIQKRYAALDATPTSLSIGAAQFRYLDGNVERSIEDMIQRADMAQYRAKKELGGNRLCLEGDTNGSLEAFGVSCPESLQSVR